MNSKVLKLVVGICAASTIVAGCGDADSHPSQMVKLRNSMQQQKNAMHGGMTTAPTPATTGNGTTGQ